MREPVREHKRAPRIMVKIVYNDHIKASLVIMMSAILEIESTKAKARFASLPRQAKARDVAITRHGHVQAYVLSPERYAHLSSVDRIGADVMQKLENDFAGLMARMQSATHAHVTEHLASAPLDAILAQANPKNSRKGKQHA